MNYVKELLNNPVLISVALSWFIAQILKTSLHTIVSHTFVAERLIGTGGMPSSHSATVCGLSASVAITAGFSSVEFAIAMSFAIVTMYDALGIRRQAGKQAQILNEMIKVFADMGREEISPEDRLKELLGHTPLQVVAGAVLGIAIAVFVCNVVF